ncbi:MAG: S1C family serine protease [Luteolibacter sp.]
MNVKLISLMLGLGAVVPVLHAAQNLETDLRKNGDVVVAAFEPARQALQTGSAVMRDGRKDIAYGTVISADGYILTKASEIQGVSSLGVIIDTAKYEGRVVSVDPVWDVALVKVEAQGLQPVSYSSATDVPQGTWVVANGATSLTRRRALPGIISAKTREIPANGGAALGVVMKEKSKAAEVESVSDRSGAHEAGIQKGDVLVAIDGKKVAKSEEIAAALKDKKAGSVVKVTYRRNGKDETVDVRLAVRSEMYDEEKSRNDQMSGEYSRRRTGFPRVIQHDILGRKDSVGGPLLDLDGKCVGMNIARADRAQSFAIPAADLKTLAEKMMKDAGK